MVLTTRTHSTLFNTSAAAASSTKTLIRLPLSVVPHYEQRCKVTGAVVPAPNKPLFRPNLWSSDEHERFLHGLEMFPNGPWKEIAKVVGTKTTRQTMTHGQKYRQKVERHLAKKPKQLPQKSRRRRMPECSKGTPSTPQEAMLLNAHQGTLAHTRAGNDPFPKPQPPASMSSPGYVDSRSFDLPILDSEFDALLSALEMPLHSAPRQGELAGMVASWSV